MAIDIGFYYRIQGGGTGALDAEPVSNLDDGALANVVDAGNGWFYVFNASSGKVPDGSRVVVPLYADSESTEYTGDGRWELQTTIKAEGVTIFNPPEIEAGECSDAVSAPAIGVLETDVVNWGFAEDVTSVTAYGANGVNIVAYPTADSVNFKACNNTASAITPGPISLNWNVVRGATTPSLPLVLNSATIGADGETWTFVFNKSAKFGAGGSGGFAVTMTGAGAITLTYASGSGTNTWTYTGDKTVYEDDTVSVGLDYTQPTDGIQDDDDVDMISFSSFSVINNSEEEDPEEPGLTTYYVDGINGDDSYDGLSLPTAKKTIMAGHALLDDGTPGDVLLIADGIYVERINISASGNSGNFKTVRAVNPGGVIVDGSSQWGQTTLTVSGDYIKIQGLKFIKGGAYVGYITSSSDHAYIKDCGFIGADQTGVYTEVFHNLGSYALVEDCWFSGAGRYLVNDSSDHSIYRRCVGRWDYVYAGTQPIGGFINYHEQSLGGGNDSVYQNCIAIDFNDPIGHNTYLSGGFSDKYGHNVTKVGCIAVNIVSSDNTGESATGDKTSQRMVGFFDEPSQQDGRSGTNVYDNCLSLGNYRGFSQARNGTTTVNNFSAFLSTLGGVGYCATSTPIVNSLFVDNGEASDNSASYSYSHFENETQRGSNSTTGESGVLYPIMIDASATAVYQTGSGGANRGAVILKKIGVDGTHYGDPGWDVITDNNLWPFPNENRIQTDFRAVSGPPAGVIPTTNDPYRGFCSTGKQLNGVDNITLTSYIWEYLGNQMPSSVY